MPMKTSMVRLPDVVRVSYVGMDSGYHGRVRLPHDNQNVPRYIELCAQDEPFTMHESATDRSWTGVRFLGHERGDEDFDGTPSVNIAFAAQDYTTAPDAEVDA